jgi:hypothetical protein
MPGWLIRLRDIVWTSVLAVALSVVAIVLAVAGVGGLVVPGVFALTSITMAVLSQRL